MFRRRIAAFVLVAAASLMTACAESPTAPTGDTSGLCGVVQGTSDRSCP